MNDNEWRPIKLGTLLAFGVCFGLFILLLLKSEPGFVFLLDGANLLFHEAGHPIFGMLHGRLEIYGGTLGQLTFPLIVIVSSWRKGNSVGVAAGSIWFFENFLNIARYMADSRALELPLVGGGHHDWNEIFFRWNVLSYDTEIATAMRIIGWIGMFASFGWFLFRFKTDRVISRHAEEFLVDRGAVDVDRVDRDRDHVRAAAACGVGQDAGGVGRN